MVPMHFGHSFRAMSKFRVVLNDFAAHFYAPGRRLQDVTLDTAMAFRWRIMECYNELPKELSAINIRFPHQLRLQYVCPIDYLPKDVPPNLLFFIAPG